MSDNRHEFSVSELAFALKRTVEETFGHVRVKGELGRVTVAKSGHCYLDIKDDKAVINSIIWKGVMSRLSVHPEEGMEVICTGKLSTYPGRSNYQLIIDHMEPAGVGALMALLEKRKAMFAAEGLFAAEHKVELPYMPRTIGVVTSPTGSVIRDILHRIEDRFPARVIVWPVLVQGDRAAEQISAAIHGFNALGENSSIPRPDVLIVARGGGSLEDLWCFNEENVVRAAAASTIPLISAVGHETDWTLIDYVADYRAPTPTGAAEVAVPVRAELLDYLEDQGQRLKRSLTRSVSERKNRLTASRLPRPEQILSAPRQRVDLAAAKLSPTAYLDRKRSAFTALRLPPLSRLVELPSQRLSSANARLAPALRVVTTRKSDRLKSLRLPAGSLQRDLSNKAQNLTRLTNRMAAVKPKLTQMAQQRLNKAGGLLTAYSYEGTLSRGYALVMDNRGALVRHGDKLSVGDEVTLRFAGDVSRSAQIKDGTSKPKTAKPKPTKTKSTKLTDQNQMGLF